MKIVFYRLLIVFITFLICINVISCAIRHIKDAPEYDGVDIRAQNLLNEYKNLAKINNIIFKHNVTIGFKTINEGNTVGLTTYGIGWREIDVDTEFWKNSTEITHLVLLFHELSHAYCDRAHDYGNGIDYPESSEERLKQAMEWAKNGGPRPGRYEDGCPVSIMYPSVLNDDCVTSHYLDYTKEMFNRCKPW